MPCLLWILSHHIVFNHKSIGFPHWMHTSSLCDESVAMNSLLSSQTTMHVGDSCIAGGSRDLRKFLIISQLIDNYSTCSYLLSWLISYWLKYVFTYSVSNKTAWISLTDTCCRALLVIRVVKCLQFRVQVRLW